MSLSQSSASQVLQVAVFTVAALSCAPPVSSSDAGVDGGFWADAGDGGEGQDGGLDGGLDAGAPGCDRLSQARTADVALLDHLRVELAQAVNDAQRTQAVDAFFEEVDAQGGTPLVSPTSERVAFVHRGMPTNSYSVAGSFNAWQVGALPMQREGTTDLWVAETNLSRSSVHQFKFVDGSYWFQDGRARNVLWDGIDRASVGEFNGLVHAGQLDPNQGRLVAFRGVPSSTFNDRRDVFVYLPPSYEQASCPVLPSLYFQDGNESLTRAPFTQPADSTYAASPQASSVLVFAALPSQDVRTSQYTFGTAGSTGDQYVSFLESELVPFIQSRFRVCPQAVDRGVAGASLGGLISAYAAFNKSGVFGYVGSQSGSFFWESNALVDRAATSASVPVRFYLDYGCPDDNCDSNRALATALLGKGYEVKQVEELNGQHQWSTWQTRLPELLRYFREGRGGCAP